MEGVQDSESPDSTGVSDVRFGRALHATCFWISVGIAWAVLPNKRKTLVDLSNKILFRAMRLL